MMRPVYAAAIGAQEERRMGSAGDTDTGRRGHLNLEDAGDGPVVLLLHGFPDSLASGAR